MDAATFRTAFPAFADSAKFPDARVAFWLSVGGKRLSAERWGDLLDQGLCLFAAHNMTLETAAAQDTAGTGGMSAAAGPVVSESKAVGPLSKSKSYNSATTAWAAAGAWNSTIYGQQFYELMQLVGVGGLHL